MKILVFLLLSLYACSSIKDNNSLTALDDIQFEGNPKIKKEVVELLDTVLREQGNMEAYGDLSSGTANLQNHMRIKIQDNPEYYSISIYPKDSAGGHDYSFKIDKKTKKISDITVGEILPPPN